MSRRDLPSPQEEGDRRTGKDPRCVRALDAGRKRTRTPLMERDFSGSG